MGLIGTGANQVPVNQFLGNLAYKDSVSFLIKTTSTNYTVSKTNDNNSILLVSGTTTVTLPESSNIPSTFRIVIKAVTGATVTVARSGSDTIETVAGDKSMIANTGLMFFPVSGGWETI